MRPLGSVPPLMDTRWLYGLPKVFHYNTKIGEESLDFPNPTFPTEVPG